MQDNLPCLVLPNLAAATITRKQCHTVLLAAHLLGSWLCLPSEQVWDSVHGKPVLREPACLFLRSPSTLGDVLDFVLNAVSSSFPHYSDGRSHGALEEFPVWCSVLCPIALWTDLREGLCLVRAVSRTLSPAFVSSWFPASNLTITLFWLLYHFQGGAWPLLTV